LIIQIFFLHKFLRVLENENWIESIDERNNSFKMYEAQNVTIDDDNFIKRLTGIGK
jgi:hypothetical protein